MYCEIEILKETENSIVLLNLVLRREKSVPRKYYSDILVDESVLLHKKKRNNMPIEGMKAYHFL